MQIAQDLDRPGRAVLGASATNKLKTYTYLIFFGTISHVGASIQEGHYRRAVWRYLDVFWCVFLDEETWCPFTTIIWTNTTAQTLRNSEKARRTLKILPALSRHEGE